MSRILKGLAIAAGAGLASYGASSVLANRRRLRSAGGPAYRPEAVLDLEPLLDRMEKIEGRLEAVNASTVLITDLERRVQAQDLAITALRSTMGDVQQQTRQVPAMIDTIVENRVDQLHARMEEKISRRIAAIERSIAEQSNSIAALREKADASDANMQRLIAAIEKLCERTPPQPEPSGFQTQLDKALENPQPQQEFRARIFKEASDEKKPRMPWAKIFSAVMTLGLTRFLNR